MNEVLARVRAHLYAHYGAPGAAAVPQTATITFVGVEPIDVVRFPPDEAGVVHHVSVGCSRYPMGDPAAVEADPVRGPRAEVVVAVKPLVALSGLARSVAVVAASPAVDGLILTPDALVDLGQPLWQSAPFTAFLLSAGDIPAVSLPPPKDPVAFISATPITATEAAWVRLKGADALRQAWEQDGVDVTDPRRRASSAGRR